MLEQAQVQGLEVNPDAFDRLQGDPTGTLHDSYDGLWRVLGRYVRRPGRHDGFHPSIGERLRRRRDYVPENLPAEVRKRLSEDAPAA
jgi:hypothetical protein